VSLSSTEYTKLHCDQYPIQMDSEMHIITPLSTNLKSHLNGACRILMPSESEHTILALSTQQLINLNLNLFPSYSSLLFFAFTHGTNALFISIGFYAKSLDGSRAR